MTIMSCEFESHFLHEEKIFAEIAQLVEHNLAKVRVASRVSFSAHERNLVRCDKSVTQNAQVAEW